MQDERITVIIPKPMKDELKIIAIKKGLTLKELVTQIFNEYLNEP